LPDLRRSSGSATHYSGHGADQASDRAAIARFHSLRARDPGLEPLARGSSVATFPVTTHDFCGNGKNRAECQLAIPDSGLASDTQFGIHFRIECEGKEVPTDVFRDTDWVLQSDGTTWLKHANQTDLTARPMRSGKYGWTAKREYGGDDAGIEDDVETAKDSADSAMIALLRKSRER
jgi:hypothetical protein